MYLFLNGFSRIQGSGDQDGDRPGSRASQDGSKAAGMSSSTSATLVPGKNRTISAPTSPLKEKKASFFGKVL
jgi:hypothetical protein